MFIIQNDILKVAIQSKGAELDSIFHKPAQLEYLWSGDPAIWPKKSPVLFPIVGRLRQNRYLFEGNAYSLDRHGFASESAFLVSKETETEIVFTLSSDEHTLRNFPFAFQFHIHYSLHANCLLVTYMVENTGEAPMYFSVGGHPAFKVPLIESTTYEDYYLEFSSKENAGRWPVSKDGLIEDNPVPLLVNTNRLDLAKELFLDDALVFKHLSSSRVSLRSGKTTHGLELDFTGFPYLGIWAAKNADFVCIEPWCGVADHVNSNQQLREKEGINKLEAGLSFERTWKITIS